MLLVVRCACLGSRDTQGGILKLTLHMYQAELARASGLAADRPCADCRAMKILTDTKITLRCSRQNCVLCQGIGIYNEKYRHKSPMFFCEPGLNDGLDLGWQTTILQ